MTFHFTCVKLQDFSTSKANAFVTLQKNRV